MEYRLHHLEEQLHETEQHAKEDVERECQRFKELLVQQQLHYSIFHPSDAFLSEPPCVGHSTAFPS